MIRINEIELEVTQAESKLLRKISKLLMIKPEAVLSYNIIKKSIDARDKSCIKYSYKIDVRVSGEKQVIKKLYEKQGIKISNNIFRLEAKPLYSAEYSLKKPELQPVIAGFGPAGIFCALTLARAGLCPLIIERGEEVDKRAEAVECFWKEGTLNLNSNVSFGEGGAGTFSDGKLNTMVKDRAGRNEAVLKTLADFGADSEILYLNNPHIGTDKLREVIKNIRKEIIRLGGEFRFSAKLEKINILNKEIKSIIISQLKKGDFEEIPCSCLVLAIGHSARDTFKMLYENSLKIEAKSFAVGVRMAHKQSLINNSQYGIKYAGLLPPASYKLTARTLRSRGVYSFCMCPGGYIVNSSTEKSMLAVNGMSYHSRAGEYANSAIIVTVSPEDFKSSDPLAGIEFQRELEKKAYEVGRGNIPVQLLGDFLNKASVTAQDINNTRADFDCFKGNACFAALNKILPDFVYASICKALPVFNTKIAGFTKADTITAGIESRTSSPVRLLRDENCQADIRGIFPCGEGAGYAGGITSAAIDGIKVAENIIKVYND